MANRLNYKEVIERLFDDGFNTVMAAKLGTVEYASTVYPVVLDSFCESLINKTLGRALDPRTNGTWLSKLTE